MSELQKQWGKRLIYLDGGMGTMLQAMGLAGGELPERWNLLHPERVREIHGAYLAAGCDIITANTFGATRAHLGEEAAACMSAGVRLARQAAQEAGHGWVAGDLGPLGRLLAPYGDMPFEEAVSQFHEAAFTAIQAGADLLLIETMTDMLEAKAAVLGAKEAMVKAGRWMPLFCSMTFDEKGRLLTGADIRGTAAMLEGLGADALGLNCGQEPKALYDNVRELVRWTRLPVFVSPNASLPVKDGDKTIFPTGPEDFGRDMEEMVALGAWGLGGCCGTTPEHIRSLIRHTADRKPVERRQEVPTLISGRSVSAVIGEKPLLIGERLNPTGKPRMKQALRDMDFDYLMGEALQQAEAGAEALDINVGLPEVDEKKLLKGVAGAVQSVCGLPVQLDTADPIALEAALREYAGRPLINSVSGKQEVMDAVFPLAAKYGGVTVALLLDESGIPETVEGRLKIARRILAEAARYGIAKSGLIFDALTLTIGTDPFAAQTTLDTVQRLDRELGVHTVLGVSNVSFGMPSRPLLTAAFAAMAVAHGLSAAILNPLDELVRGVWWAVEVLGGAALERPFHGPSDRELSKETALKPQSGILLGLIQGSAQAARKLLSEGMEPLRVVEEMILPALSEVGERFEKGTLFLPQLLQSAKAAQAAFDEVRAHLPETALSESPKVALATVQGDVHDIGKNIVKVLLQNYGFSVLDLGRDVAPEDVLAAVRESGAVVVGLSALMTTTVPAMEKTIALVKKELPHVRVMVGGAVLTAEYAAQMGADGYGKDAMGAVRLAREWTQGTARTK